MNEIELLVIGAGGHAGAVLDVIRHLPTYRVIGLVGRDDEVGTNKHGLPVVGSDTDLTTLRAVCDSAVVCIGHIESVQPRMKAFKSLRKLGFQLPTIVSPLAYVSSTSLIGAGSVIMHRSVVNCGSVVGVNSIINTGAIVEHDVNVGSHCHLAPGAIVGGGTTLGDECFIGSGATVRNGLTLGNRVLVGMGVAVRHDKSHGEWVTDSE